MVPQNSLLLTKGVAVAEWSGCGRRESVDEMLKFQSIAKWRKISRVLPGSSVNPDFSDLVLVEHWRQHGVSNSHTSRQPLYTLINKIHLRH